MIAGPGAGAAQIGGDGRFKLQEPATDGLVGDVQWILGRFSCRDCGEIVEKQVTPPMPGIGRTVGYI